MIINNLIEIHSHILPNIDDGSRSIEMSLEMINRLKEQGCKRIVLTPHYYSDTISLDDFLDKRDKAFNALIEALPPDSPELIPAAEVYISQYLFNNDSIDRLCIGNSKYVLIEHPFSASFGETDYDRLMNMYCDYGVKPVLAHIERYPALMNDPDIIQDYIDMGCITQVNIDTFVTAPRSIKKRIIKYMNNGLIHLIGSDCHNLDSRPPEYEEGVKTIIKKCGEDAIEILMHNANQLTK